MYWIKTFVIIFCLDVTRIDQVNPRSNNLRVFICLNGKEWRKSERSIQFIIRYTLPWTLPIINFLFRGCIVASKPCYFPLSCELLRFQSINPPRQGCDIFFSSPYDNHFLFDLSVQCSQRDKPLSKTILTEYSFSGLSIWWNIHIMKWVWSLRQAASCLHSECHYCFGSRSQAAHEFLF